jgi:hypothetical protein
MAQNYLAQQWLNDFNSLDLPVWSALSGSLLDWVGAGLYGIQRPILSYQQPAPIGAGSGPYNTMAWNTSVYGGGKLHPANTNPITYLPVTDDVYQRILTWHLYKGDGFQFSTEWLKRRVHRFMDGANGFLPIEDNHYDVSITSSGTAITITVSANQIGTVLQYAVTDGVLALPFQFTYTVSPTVISFPDAGAGNIFGTAAIRANTTLRANSGALLLGAAGIGGNTDLLSGSVFRWMAVVSGSTSIGADFVVVHATGPNQWQVAGAMSAQAGIRANVFSRVLMGGTFPGVAG